MKVKRHGPRRAVAGLILTAILFALIFTAGVGYLLFQSQADRYSYAANLQAMEGRQSASQEQIASCARSVSAGSCKAVASGGSLTVTVNDTGGFPVSVISWFLKDSMTGAVLSPPGVVQLASPVNLDVGNSASFPLTGYTYTTGTILVSLVTSRGNVFTVQFPLDATSTTITQTSTSTTVTGPGSGGGNSLVVIMAATPLQAFSGDTITDNVTLSNWSNVAMTSATLVPSPPTYATTGTAGLTSTGCTGPFTHGQVPDPSGTIAAYSGSGVPPNLFFLCTYRASSGAVGGLVSFSGGASALQGINTIYSAQATSNLVQIGGLTNPYAQGAFTSNFFFFMYSSCQPNAIAPSGGTSCTLPAGTETNYAGAPNVNNFPQASVISAGSNYYVAFYLSITNIFNKPLPLLQYTFEQFEAGAGNESDWWLVGTTAAMSNGTYYPNYTPPSGPPTLTPYPADCATVNSNNVPTDPDCIYVNPGQTVTITLAACGPGVSKWDWGSSQYGVHFDTLPVGVGCTSSTPYLNNGGSATGSATAAITVISYEYNGLVYTQDIAFQGVAFVG